MQWWDMEMQPQQCTCHPQSLPNRDIDCPIHGFTEHGGWIIKPGAYWDGMSEKEKLCLEFLADEWDYAFDFRPVNAPGVSPETL